MAKVDRPPKLPKLLERKLYKTGQTRGADDDVIFQNRVLRNSTVLIPLSQWSIYKSQALTGFFENGYIVLAAPDDLLSNQNSAELLASEGLALDRNLLVYYENRSAWNKYPPSAHGLTLATSRNPLRGMYAARIPGTTSKSLGQGRIADAFIDSSNKGAGIRVYEYANSATILETRLQLEALVWKCHDAAEVMKSNFMTEDDVVRRRSHNQEACERLGLGIDEKLIANRLIDSSGVTICPLCLTPISAQGFFDRLIQAVGREVNDLTVTSLNLFHVIELKFGEYNHRSYNLGWGHHHCNVVARDVGIYPTLDWMCEVIDRNIEAGYLGHWKRLTSSSV